MEELLEILLEIRPDVDFENEKSLIDKKILDSFDVVSIIGTLSDEYDIEIPVEEIDPKNFNKIEDIKALIDKLMEE